MKKSHERILGSFMSFSNCYFSILEKS